MTRLVLQRVGASYGEREVLRQVSLSVAEGEQVALLGPNGAGKSTLLRVCAGLHRPASGIVELDGDRLGTAEAVADRVVFISQEAPTTGDLTAGELVLTGLAPTLGAWADGGPAGIAKAEAAMHSTGTHELAARRLSTLSGGELRRVVLARALMRAPRLLLLDEPLASLDLGAQGRVLDLLTLAASRGAAVLVALHDLNLARRCFHRVVLLVAGEVVADGPPAEVLQLTRVESAFGAAEHEAGLFFPRCQTTPVTKG